MVVSDFWMLERVVPRAQMGEVVDLGPPALRMIESVIDLAPMRRHPAAGESAVLISRTEEPPHGFCRPVGVGLDDKSGRIEEQPGPSAVAAREIAGDIGVQRPVSVELRGAIVAPRERGGGDCDLDAPLDVVES